MKRYFIFEVMVEAAVGWLWYRQQVAGTERAVFVMVVVEAARGGH